MKILKIYNYFIIALLILGTVFTYFPNKVARAEALCSGADISVTVTDLTTGLEVGVYTASGGDTSPYMQYNVSIPYNHEIKYDIEGSGTPSFTLGRLYKEGGTVINNEHSYFPHPSSTMSSSYTAPLITSSGSFYASRTENACTAQEGYLGDQMASVNLNISVGDNFALSCTPLVEVPYSTSADASTIVPNWLTDLSGGYSNAVTVSLNPSPDGIIANPANKVLVSPGYADDMNIIYGSIPVGTYSLEFSATDGAITKTCTTDLVVLAINQIPNLNLQVNGTEGPVEIRDGETALISWETFNVDTCTATSNPTISTSVKGGIVGWDGDITPLNNVYPSGLTVGPFTGPQEYTLTLNCTGPYGDAYPDSVVISVGIPPSAPTVDLKCQGNIDSKGSTDGPCSVSYNSSALLSWTSTNAESCSIDNGFGTASPVNSGSGMTGSLTSSTSYTITCTNASGSTEDRVSLDVISNSDFTISCSAASVSITQGNTGSFNVQTNSIDGFSSPVTFSKSIAPVPGSAPTITFSPTSQTPSPSGNISVATVSTNSNTSTGTYTVTFSATGGGQTHTKDCTLIIAAAPPPPSPVTVSVSNGGACGTIDVSWSRGSGTLPSGFYVYRSTDGVIWGAPWQDVPYLAKNYTLNDPSPLAQTGNYYAVASYTGTSVSEKVEASNNPIATVLCEANMSLSDKDLISVQQGGVARGNSASATCSNNSEVMVLPNNAVFKPGDIVKFQINICNSGNSQLDSITVEDTLSNLSNPDNFESPDGCLNTSKVMSDTSIYFEAAPVPAASPDTQFCRITFTAVVTAPADAPASGLYRFQNKATITTAQGTKNVFTPPYIFSVGAGAPNRQETSPR